MEQHYCYITTIKSKNNTYYYFGKHTGFIGDGYIGSGKFVEDAKASGKCTFDIKALSYFETSDLAFEFEELLIENAMSEVKNCVNMKPGGIGGFGIPSEETLLLLSSLLKERWLSPEYKERVSESIKKAWENPEHRKRMKDIHKAYNADPKVRAEKSRKNRKHYHIDNYKSICKNPTYQYYDEFLKIWLENNKPSYYKFMSICSSLGYIYTSNNFRALVDRFKRAYERNEIDEKQLCK